MRNLLFMRHHCFNTLYHSWRGRPAHHHHLLFKSHSHQNPWRWLTWGVWGLTTKYGQKLINQEKSKCKASGHDHSAQRRQRGDPIEQRSNMKCCQTEHVSCHRTLLRPTWFRNRMKIRRPRWFLKYLNSLIIYLTFLCLQVCSSFRPRPVKKKIILISETKINLT